MASLDLVGALIDGGADLHGRLVDDRLKPLGFTQGDSSEANRVVVGPSARLFAAGHRFEVWLADGIGRVVWFWLDSEIPHMSAIVACVCMPCESYGLPLFVMNLNLKLKAGTFNTIMGYRGPPDRLVQFRSMFPVSTDFPATVSPPDLVKENPHGFEGVRCMFTLQRPPIVWALGLAEECLNRWFEALSAAGRKDPSTALLRDEQYFDEAIKFHSREGGGVYDAVFGPGWLATLFRDRVFG